MEAPPKGENAFSIPTSLTDLWKLAIAERRNWTELPYGVDEEKKPHCHGESDDVPQKTENNWFLPVPPQRKNNRQIWHLIPVPYVSNF